MEVKHPTTIRVFESSISNQKYLDDFDPLYKSIEASSFWAFVKFCKAFFGLDCYCTHITWAVPH